MKRSYELIVEEHYIRMRGKRLCAYQGNWGHIAHGRGQIFEVYVADERDGGGHEWDDCNDLRTALRIGIGYKSEQRRQGLWFDGPWPYKHWNANEDADCEGCEECQPTRRLLPGAGPRSDTL